MEKRSVLDTDKGAIIIKTRIFPDGQVTAEITAVDLYRGKNVSVGLGPRELEALQRHIRELRRARDVLSLPKGRSQKAREAQSKRRQGDSP